MAHGDDERQHRDRDHRTEQPWRERRPPRFDVESEPARSEERDPTPGCASEKGCRIGNGIGIEARAGGAVAERSANREIRQRGDDERKRASDAPRQGLPTYEVHRDDVTTE